jgi:Zn-finger nucleic acid-binding protein
MRLLSMLVSRERELLADAAAVELSRAPEALARAVYKAHIKNSFVGDFTLSYSPLFIVSPDSRDAPDNLLGRIFSSHPPLMKRLGALSAMVRKKPEAIAHSVWEEQRAREQARGVLHSYEELREEQLELFPGASGPFEPSGPVDEARIWLLAFPSDEGWEGPFTMGELLCRPRFSAVMRVKNTQEGVEARAREFPQVRAALRNMARRKPLAPGRENRCPRCGIPLTETFYEGIAIRLCGRCRGRLVDMAGVDRIIARKEFAFSEDLVRKAGEFRERVLLNPLKRQKMQLDPGGRAACPGCGARMAPRPFSYQYFVPVDKCLACSKIWFDADELEILQVLIESRKAKP